MNNYLIEFDICDQEIKIIIDHIESLGSTITNKIYYEIDIYWKNWLSIYEDYVYVISLLQKSQKIILFTFTKEETKINRYDIYSKKYIGIFFPLWFKIIKNNNYILNLQNNIFVGLTHEDVSSIEGDEKYKVILVII